MAAGLVAFMTKKIELPRFALDIRDLVGEGRVLPPVESWHPEREGDIDIRISKDGSWFYQGDKIEREALVQLFSSILRKDGKDYFWVTPAEKLKIVVENAPFLVCMVDVEGVGKEQKLHFSTNVGDCFTLSAAHPLTVKYNEKGEPAPYVTVRGNLNALLSRKVYYELVDLVVASESNKERYGVWSDGQFFLI